MKNSSFTLNYCNSLKSLTQIVWTVNIGKMAIPDRIILVNTEAEFFDEEMITI